MFTIHKNRPLVFTTLAGATLLSAYYEENAGAIIILLLDGKITKYVVKTKTKNIVSATYEARAIEGIKIDSRIEKTADEVNQTFKLINPNYNPPYAANSIVHEIKLTENTLFVRAYDATESPMKGGWVMKAEDIAGLTAEQIKDKFALEHLPKYICDVEIPAGTTIRMGYSWEIEGWGNGGGLQFDFMQQHIGDFYNQRLL